MDVTAQRNAQKTAVLCSAGLDSAVLLAHEAEKGPVTPIYVHVGLAWEAEERRALDRLLAAHHYAGRINDLAVLELTMRDVYAEAHWAVVGQPPAYDTPDEDVYLLGRNLVLLTKAAVFCAQQRIPRIVLGPLAGNPFPDASPEFFDAMARALSLGLDCGITIDTPFRTLHKADVVKLGHALGVPLELSLSCMRPTNGKHCGACSKCRERHDAFLDARLDDPTTYIAPSPRRQGEFRRPPGSHASREHHGDP